MPAALDLGTATWAASFDAVVWRRLAAVQISVGRPEQFYDDPDIRSRVAAALDGRDRPAPPAPSRAELLRVVRGAGR